MNFLQTVFNAPQENLISASIKKWKEDETQKLREGYVKLEKYYMGHQGAKVTDRIKRILKGAEFRDNFCAPVVDSMAERLNVIGFEAKGEVPEKITKWAWETWQRAG